MRRFLNKIKLTPPLTFELELLTIYLIHDLLDHVRKLARQNPSNRVFINWSNNRISERYVGECSVLSVYQKSEALNLKNNTLHYENLQIKLTGQMGILHDT